MCFSTLAQESTVKVQDNIFVYQLNYLDSVKSEIWIVGKILKSGDSILLGERIKLVFEKHSLINFWYDVDTFNNPEVISSKYTEACKLDNQKTNDSFHLENLFFTLLDKGDSLFRLSSDKAESKMYYDAAQKLIRVLNLDSLNFLNEYLMYINLDQFSLESHYYDALSKKDDLRIYLIARAGSMNNYTKSSKIEFENILYNNYEWQWLFYFNSKNSLEGRIKKAIHNETFPIQLNPRCLDGDW